jgi:hypothetical protein
MGMFLGIMCAAGLFLRADEAPVPAEIGNYHGPTGNTYRQDANNPKAQLAEITGTIKSIDQISGKIKVQDDKGPMVGFSIEENTLIKDHNIQIDLEDLHVGDRVTVSYNVEPQLVNQIERI